MTRFSQTRTSALTRCTAALALISFSATTFAQSPAGQVSQAVPPASQSAAPVNDSQKLKAYSPKPNADAPNLKAPSKHQVEAADDAYLAGARLLDHKEYANAEAQFAKALKLNPANHEYALALTMAREHHLTELVQESSKARLLGENQKADALLAEARLLDPQNSIVTQHYDPGAVPKVFRPEIEPWMQQAPALAGPVTLVPNTSVQSFHIHSDLQDVIRQVLSSYGVRPAFDDSVKQESVRFDLDNSTYQQAVPILLRMAHLFTVTLDAKSVYIAKDTPENRQHYERLLQETIYIPGMTNEQMDELGNVVRNVFDVKQISVEKTSGNLVIRAPEDILTPINLTLADLLDGGSQVMIDLKLYSVDKTHQHNIGTQLPQQFGIYSVAQAANDIVNANQSLVTQAIAQGLIPANASNITIALALIASGLVQSTLLSSTLGLFGGGITLFGLTISQPVTFNLALNTSDTRSLDDIQVRVGDRQTADFRAGTRYPITTSTYTNSSPANSVNLAGVTINGVSAASLLNNASAITIPQIQYEDLGLTLKATPTVQKSGEITMHIDLKIEALAGGSVNNIPILESRQFVSDVTVENGEPALLFSTVSRTESAAISGIPGLGELPGFQVAAADNTTEVDSSELVLVLTPHVVRRRSSITAGPRIAVNLPEQPD
jgi:general secretion pathway protein D